MQCSTSQNCDRFWREVLLPNVTARRRLLQGSTMRTVHAVLGPSNIITFFSSFIVLSSFHEGESFRYFSYRANAIASLMWLPLIYKKNIRSVDSCTCISYENGCYEYCWAFSVGIRDWMVWSKIKIQFLTSAKTTEIILFRFQIQPR
jgi:hypothetical protein